VTVVRYWVFGRKGYPQPLEHQGTLEAADDDSARQQARQRFGDGWVELVLVREPDVHWVLRTGQEEGSRVAGGVG
jgi:1,2-phenylacetyl-CoA epoxidase PaaB subunit